MTASPQRLILLEFNELCPSLIEKFIAEGILPNFARLKARSETYVTHTTEEHLEPWIQWVTLHTGVPVSVHGIMDLDEANKLRHQPFWDQLRDDPVLLVSPMNVKFAGDDRSIFLPDPWAASQAQATSKEVLPFYRFIRSAVNSHARTDKLDASSAMGAAKFLLSHGMSFDSMLGAIRQLWQEKFGAQDVKWRRATILDRLLWDVFAHFWKSPRQPRVGVFFSNATAHYQHKYWAHHDPALFSLKPSASELATYGDAIRFGYRAHDALIGKAISLAGSESSIALCTALSQQPMRDYEGRGGKAMFVPKDYQAMLPAFGVTEPFRDEALMAEESWLHFESPTACQQAIATLSAIRTDQGLPVFKFRNAASNSCIVGCAVFTSEVAPGATVVLGDGRRVPFAEHFIAIPTVTTGKHHPDGVFWLARARDQRQEAASLSTRLPLTQVRSKLEQALALG